MIRGGLFLAKLTFIVLWTLFVLVLYLLFIGFPGWLRRRRG